MVRDQALNIPAISISRQIKLTSVIGLVTTVVALIVLAQNYFKYAATTEDYSIKLSLIYNLIVYGSYALTTPLILKLSERIPLNEGKWYWKVFIHLGISFGLALIHMVFCNVLLFAIDLSSSPIFLRFVTKYMTNVIHVHLIIYWAIVLLISFQRNFFSDTGKIDEPVKETEINHFTIKENGRQFFVDFNDVCWIEAQDHYQKLYTVADGPYMIKDSMKNLEYILSNSSIKRAHRSYFVNASFVKAILKNPKDQRGEFLELQNGVKLKLSKPYRPHFNF